jgi:hypothetical protein
MSVCTHARAHTEVVMSTPGGSVCLLVLTKLSAFFCNSIGVNVNTIPDPTTTPPGQPPPVPRPTPNPPPTGVEPLPREYGNPRTYARTRYEIFPTYANTPGFPFVDVFPAFVEPLKLSVEKFCRLDILHHIGDVLQRQPPLGVLT